MEQAPPEPAYDNIMIDIESMSLRTNALILSIGAVAFSLDDTGPHIGRSMLAVPSLRDQLIYSRHVDPSTQAWWADGERDDARVHWESNTNEMGLKHALLELVLACKGAKAIWANGIVFDIGVLEHAYQQVGLKPPWKYNMVRDARTIYKVFGTRRHYTPAEAILDGVPHHPISDCRGQIYGLWEAGLNT